MTVARVDKTIGRMRQTKIQLGAAWNVMPHCATVSEEDSLVLTRCGTGVANPAKRVNPKFLP